MRLLLIAVLLLPSLGVAAVDDFRLKGVLVSSAGNSALINNTIAREGDRVAGATILAIGEGQVRIRKGPQQFIVKIGGTAVQASPAKPAPAAPDEYAVKYGDTLSEISEHYLRDGMSLNQVMMAVFEANPEAFDGNINRLRAGANLRIPNLNSDLPLPRGVATAQVQRHEDAWRAGSHVPDSHVERFGQLDRPAGLEDRAFPGLADGVAQIAAYQTVTIDRARKPHGIPTVYYRRPH